MYTLFYLVYCICSFFLLIPFVLCAAHQRLLAGSAHLARLLTMSTLRREAATQLWHKHGSYRVPPPLVPTACESDMAKQRVLAIEVCPCGAVHARTNNGYEILLIANTTPITRYVYI